MSIKQTVFNHLKNIPGWRTNRKFVVISVDDYGNVRLDSKKARQRIDAAGLKVHSRFDAYDTLETKVDLESLFEVLTSVKDHNGSHAVFTPFTLPCNINFEAMTREGNIKYISEQLPETYKKLAAMQPKAYDGAWSLWKEGIENGIMVPQFHGREHFNLQSFETKLKSNNSELLISLANRSLTSISSSEIPNVGWTAAFSFNKREEIASFPDILRTGTDAFENVFGFRSKTFTPPAQQFPEQLEKSLRSYGITTLDKPFYRQRHLGNGNYKREFNFLSVVNQAGLSTIVRNVVFEPTNGRIDHVSKALAQIEAAFKFGKPANISSHRVNYCGLIEESNRNVGLEALKKLLYKIVDKWPEVEFLSSADLSAILQEKQ